MRRSKMTEQSSTSKTENPKHKYALAEKYKEEKEKYIGSHIKSKLGDEYASNESYEEYYKDLI